MTESQFKNRIWNFYDKNKREFSWRKTTNPYHILVSEVMLQQTQVSRVELKYQAFIHSFPSFSKLAKSSQKDILELWQGLGYYRRALALKRISETIERYYNGKLPKEYSELIRLPGIGPGTAGAILAYAYNLPIAFIETNIRRVFLYHFFPKRKSVSDIEIFPIIRKTVDQRNPREWYYALTDYGAHLGVHKENPNKRSAHYTIQPPFKGSHRELRGKIIRALLQTSPLSKFMLARINKTTITSINDVLLELKNEGFLSEKNNHLSIL
jgi:A/G-specific adenine glycosylase